MTQKPVKKAVVLAAGFGTRFLPASKAVPKVMFPVIDKPIIQAVVEEIIQAGITDIIVVVSRFTKEIERHFKPFEELNQLLEKNGKTTYLEELKKIESMAKFTFVEQIPGRIGNGVAVLSAKEAIGNEPFVLTWSDEFFKAQPNRIKQLVDAYNEFGGMILGCIKTTNPKDGNRFGFVVGEEVRAGVVKAKEIIEKPGEGKAPSEMATMSGAIIQPEIFDYLEKSNKEVDLKQELYYNTYGTVLMLKDGFNIHGIEYQNYHYYDTGDRFGYLKALVELGIDYPDFGAEFKEWLKNLKI